MPGIQRQFFFHHLPDRIRWSELLIDIPQQQFHLCDVLISAAYRHHGFGTQGLRLLCQAAKENNIPALYDDIAADNPSYQLFLKNGFELVSQNESIVLVRQIL